MQIAILLSLTHSFKKITLSPGHIHGPFTPNSVIGDQDHIPALNQIGHDAFHTSMTGGRQGQGHLIFGLECILNTSLAIVHDLSRKIKFINNAERSKHILFKNTFWDNSKLQRLNMAIILPYPFKP